MACIHYVRDRGWHPMAIVLRLFKGAGVATPWLRIYILASLKNRSSLKGLLRHEICHIRQMQRDGWFTFWTQYFWWTITKGYGANPYEVEAYAVSHFGGSRLPKAKPGGRRQVSPSACLRHEARRAADPGSVGLS